MEGSACGDGFSHGFSTVFDGFRSIFDRFSVILDRFLSFLGKFDAAQVPRYFLDGKECREEIEDKQHKIDHCADLRTHRYIT